MGSWAVGVSTPFLTAEPGAARRIPLPSHLVPAFSESGWRLFAPSSCTGSARALRVQVAQAPKVNRTGGCVRGVRWRGRDTGTGEGRRYNSWRGGGGPARRQRLER